MEIDDKIKAVDALHWSLTLAPPGRNAELSEWIKPILAEVAELPKYRALVHGIRQMVSERNQTHLKRR